MIDWKYLVRFRNSSVRIHCIIRSEVNWVQSWRQKFCPIPITIEINQTISDDTAHWTKDRLVDSDTFQSLMLPVASSYLLLSLDVSKQVVD